MLSPEPYLLAQVDYNPPPKGSSGLHQNNDSDFTNPMSSPQHAGGSTYGMARKIHSHHGGGGGLSGQRTRFTVRELIKIF